MGADVGVVRTASAAAIGATPTSVMSLDEVLVDAAFRESVVLFDTNILATGLPEATFHNDHYRSIDLEILHAAEQHYERLEPMLRLPYVYTVAGVIRELQQGFAIMRDRTAFWNRQEVLAQWHHRKKKASVSLQQQKVAELNIKELQLEKLARHAVYAPQEPRMRRTIATAIQAMEVALAVKRDTQPWDLQLRREYHGHHDHRTDEELVATALYASLLERRPAAIVTRDMDIPALAATAYALLTAEGYLLHWRTFRNQLHAAPLRIYVPAIENRESYRLLFETGNARRHFRGAPALSSATPEAIAAVREEFARAFEKVHSYQQVLRAEQVG